MISSIYRDLLSEHIHELSLPVMNKWVSDIGQITEEQWEYVLGLTPRLSLCEAQHSSQLLIHRAYKSLSLSLKICVRSDSRALNVEKMMLTCIYCVKAQLWGGLEGRTGSNPHCT